MRGLMSTALRALRDAAARRAAAAPPALAAGAGGRRAAAAAAAVPAAGCSISSPSSQPHRSWGAARRFSGRAAAPASSTAAAAAAAAGSDAAADGEPTCWRCTVDAVSRPLRCAAAADATRHHPLSSPASAPPCGPLSQVSGETADELTDVLLSFGAQSASVEEYRPEGSEEQPIYDADGDRLWERCTVVAHFALEADVEGAFGAARSILGLPDLSYTRAGVANQARPSARRCCLAAAALPPASRRRHLPRVHQRRQLAHHRRV
jgi:hypothetical protein